MRKVIVSLVAVLLVLSVGVFAGSNNIAKDIVNFVEKKGISIDDSNISEVNFSDLPGGVDIEKIENSSVVIYKIDYGIRPLFVVSNSNNKKIAPSISEYKYKSLLNFGVNGKIDSSSFLNMDGVKGGSENGYVMMRSGSISGISSILNVVEYKEEEVIEVRIYKNGKVVGLRNSLNAEKKGSFVDYDTLSEDIIKFDAGDIISVYVNFGDGVSIANVVTVLEIVSQDEF
jgi:hypothetical protein